MHFDTRARQASTRSYPSHSPIDLVESGQDILTEWLHILSDQRAVDEQIGSSVARERYSQKRADFKLRMASDLSHEHCLFMGVCKQLSSIITLNWRMS